ncbi:hypothetical protein [Rhodoferax aquaticus]|uniref:Uncharacterized protein n=1 Tax=Rhodoferax aquaticus TaxID=2527691 RepID=A0A515ERR2_9BURK|nr:hypothetical protein [Rhodoferax aquaticus]QDL55340.1 hypothetical protein EXZ61_14815 [Rhodoferax aquaticus]
MLHPSLAHLEDIDTRFLDPNARFVVMPETTEAALEDANLALVGLSCMLDTMESQNIKLHQAGGCLQYVELPPDCLSALLRMVAEKIKPCTNNPTLGAVQHLRPDLFNTSNRGN